MLGENLYDENNKQKKGIECRVEEQYVTRCLTLPAGITNESNEKKCTFY